MVSFLLRKGVLYLRTLKFIVDELIVKKDPKCDFSNIVPGTEGYLKAEFSFTPEWDGTLKVVEFRRNFTECEPKVLVDGKSCIIPAEALISKAFKLRVLGKGKDDMKLTTNYVVVEQNGGK